MAFSLRDTYTALVTPLNGEHVDWDALERLVAFQSRNGCGILANGTTAETPALTFQEQAGILSRVLDVDEQAIAGTGANSTDAALQKTTHAVEAGARACLLVDCYYNGPSSHELRMHYYGPIVSAFADTAFIPYVIPGRTGCALLPEDLALLSSEHANVVAVKEATGDLSRMARTRAIAPSLPIFSGDDDLTHGIMTRTDIRAQGVISVMANLVPQGVSRMVDAVHAGRMDEAAQLNHAMQPLFSMVGVKTTEDTPFGPVVQKWRNPLPVKTALAGLGVIASGCRQPLGRMSAQGVEAVRQGVQDSYARMPELFAPLESFFGVDVQDATKRSWTHLAYPAQKPVPALA